MENLKTINGFEAMARMTQMRHSKRQHFTMHHLTWNRNKHCTNGMRIVERARLRPALPGERFEPDGDLYLPYNDIDIKEPRMCFKKLIRYVAFPPDYKLLKVNWFKK